MTVKNISWSISTWSISMKECCRLQRGSNPWPPRSPVRRASNWATKAGSQDMLLNIFTVRIFMISMVVWFTAISVCRITSTNMIYILFSYFNVTLKPMERDALLMCLWAYNSNAIFIFHAIWSVDWLKQKFYTSIKVQSRNHWIDFSFAISEDWHLSIIYKILMTKLKLYRMKYYFSWINFIFREF